MMPKEEEVPLLVVGIETKLGAQYLFPDVPATIIEPLLKNEGFRRFEQLSLVNASKSCLVINTRTIRYIFLNGELKWASTV